MMSAAVVPTMDGPLSPNKDGIRTAKQSARHWPSKRVLQGAPMAREDLESGIRNPCFSLQMARSQLLLCLGVRINRIKIKAAKPSRTE